MKKLFALLAAAAMVLSASSAAVQPAFAESPDPMEPSTFIENIGEITPVGEPQPIGETSLHALSADEEFTLEIVDSFPLTEEMIAEAESQFQPAETNEISPMANQPDLYPTAFSADTENYHEPFAADRPVIFTFYIYNTGDAPASNIVVEYDVDGVIESGRRATLNTTIQAGYALKVESQVICPNAGNYQIHLTINPDHTSSEERYDNNSVTSALYTWAEFADTYDFKAVSLDAQNYPNDALPVNVPVTYQFTIANVGGKSGSVPIQITANGSPIIDGSSGEIPPGYAQNYTFEFSLNYSLTFNLGLTVNPDQSVAEWRTDNNAYTGQFTAIISTDPEDVYGALGFGYPLPEEYTATFDYPNHNGFDISAPENTEIYSIDDGTVGFAGYFYRYGYYISIINNTYDPTKSTASPIITRYLHMNSQDSMLVGEDEPVDRGQIIGLVGSRGYSAEMAKGIWWNHLHIDANSQGIVSGDPGSALIHPKLFWPDVDFHKAEGTDEMWQGQDWSADFTMRAQNKSCNDIPSDQEIIESGGYVSGALIDYIGAENFENWIAKQSGVWTVYDLLIDFNISDEKLQEIVSPRIYDLYMKYRSNWAIPSDQAIMESGGYVSGRLIEHIGEANFEDWKRNQPGNWTVYDLIEDFNISNKQLKEIVFSRVYESYIKYLPAEMEDWLSPDSEQ